MEQNTKKLAAGWERRTFEGGFSELSPYALALEKWLERNPGKCGLDYNRIHGTGCGK